MSTSLSPTKTINTANMAFEERFGRQVARRLSAGNLDLPHDFSERLRAARVQAIARRKITLTQAVPVVLNSGGVALLGGGWWRRVGTIIPLIALVVGLIGIRTMQENNHAREEAEVDAALLTDDLPPAAFTDPGFTQFLKSDGAAAAN